MARQVSLLFALVMLLCGSFVAMTSAMSLGDQHIRHQQHQVNPLDKTTTGTEAPAKADADAADGSTDAPDGGTENHGGVPPTKAASAEGEKGEEAPTEATPGEDETTPTEGEAEATSSEISAKDLEGEHGDLHSDFPQTKEEEEHGIDGTGPEGSATPDPKTEVASGESHDDSSPVSNVEAASGQEEPPSAAENLANATPPPGAATESDVPDGDGSSHASPKGDMENLLDPAPTESNLEKAEVDVASHMVNDIKHLDPWLDPKKPDRLHVLCVFLGLSTLILCLGCCIGQKCQ